MLLYINFAMCYSYVYIVHACMLICILLCIHENFIYTCLVIQKLKLHLVKQETRYKLDVKQLPKLQLKVQYIVAS